MGSWRRRLVDFVYKNGKSKESNIRYLEEKLKTFLFHEHATNVRIKRIDEKRIVVQYQVLSSEYLQVLPTNISYISPEGNFIYGSDVALDKNLNTGKESYRRQSYLKLLKTSSHLFKEIEKKIKRLSVS